MATLQHTLLSNDKMHTQGQHLHILGKNLSFLPLDRLTPSQPVLSHEAHIYVRVDDYTSWIAS